ncbi:ferrichrome ABC transporter substrate-binding protein [Paenibacillus pectinilyticus]|uniref:Ferrichrome ABC transporter substrate-binding protein n=1 Tax=Paenibacillus pectinilyticus TaxID=512399 RepID=A0A1C1A1V6_9BACL|nr:iron-siderophore ABC transporter substrate-binding protein [Paenibacillus pectinilyticus]OCT14507.1 ferrichrome ABC transporter substrate-binding protein [Paenibacillus pectinilyticus]
MLLLITSACGSTTSTSTTSTSTSAPSVQPAATPATDAVKTITHPLGTTTIKGTPKRVVTLEWAYTEDVLALGIQPVGAADIKGYQNWVNVKPALDASVVDVGTRQEPNLETITGLKPDLIITSTLRSSKNYEALSKIAPTIVFESYPAEGKGDQFEGMLTTFKTIADVTGKKAEGDKVTTDLDKSFADLKTKLIAAKKDGAEFALTQAYSNQNNAELRMFTDNSMVVQILQRIGLKNVFKSSKFELYGFSTASVEALPAVQNANFFYIVQDADNVFEKQLKDNAVWKGLSFVKENKTFKLPGNTWTFGGPLSAKVFAELAATSLMK